jgi:S1-C subfamily serine protease
MLRAGEPLIALGSPRGDFTNTVTHGGYKFDASLTISAVHWDVSG